MVKCPSGQQRVRLDGGLGFELRSGLVGQMIVTATTGGRVTWKLL